MSRNLETVFEELFAATNTSDNKDGIVEFLKAAKLQLESTSVKLHKPAKSFSGQLLPFNTRIPVTRCLTLLLEY